MATGSYWAKKELPGQSASELLARYRAVFFLRFALAEAPILVGFAGFFLTGGRLWVYGIGLAFGMVALLRIAPTKRDIQRRQAELNAQGSTLSLGRLLTLPNLETKRLIEQERGNGDG